MLANGAAMADNGAMRLGGLILAGGRSRRMGRPKESLPFAGTTLLGWQCRTLAGCTAPVVVVARDRDQALPGLPGDADVVADAEPDLGPLAGIAAGLARLRDRHGFGADDATFVTGCDLPGLTAAAVRWLAGRLGDASVLMPRARGALQPLAAIYRLRLLPHIDALLRAGERTPRQLATADDAVVLDEPELAAFDPALRWLDDVDDPADYLAAQRALPPPEGRP